MPAFALPRAVSPRVAATLSRFAHHALLDRVWQRARTYDVGPAAGAARAALPRALPQQLTLIFDGADRGTPTQLHLGRVPVPSRLWSYDADRGVLSYQVKSGGVDHVGRLTFVHAASGAIGTVSVGGEHVGVTATLRPVSYTCDVAVTPAAFVTGVAPALALHWDATDPRWSSATWITDALTFTWQVTGQVIVGQPTYSIAVSFRDEQTGRPWAPGAGEISALLDANLDFTMTLAGGFIPPPDDRSGLPAPAASIASVLPYALGFGVSSDGTEITGALLTGQTSQAGTVLGLRGRVVNPSATGLYAVSGTQGAAGAIAVYGGRLYIDDAPVETASLTGNRLAWNGLTATQRQQSGLPESGAVVFQADGAQCRSPQGQISGRRLRPDQVPRQLQDTAVSAHPALATAGALSTSATLSVQALGSMTQFAFANNVWVDAVQQATMANFNQILQYHMPDDMRQTYYDQSPPILPPWLQAIAAQGTNPAAMYQSLATAYLTNILSHFNEDGASQLNAARAMTWLKTQTAASPVFQQHTTAIYGVEFVNRPQNTTLPLYRDDQVTSASTYAPLISDDAEQWRKTLAATIQDRKARARMQQLATDLESHAVTDNLYWAYAFFRYLTSPAELLIIQMISLGNTSDLDGSAFMRQCQANAAILSLLDPSNTFSQKYVEVIQVVQIGNMLPALFDLSGPDPDDFVFDIQLVLQQIAKAYQGDSDPDVAAAASLASALAQDQKLRDYVDLAQSIGSANAGLGAWDQLAPTIQGKLTAVIGPKATGVFMMALAGVGLMGIVKGSMQWRSLRAEEQADIAANAAGFAIEFVCAVVKRGVAMAAIWSSSNWEIFKGLVSGDIFKAATNRLSSAFRRWIVERDVDNVGHAIPPGALLWDEVTGDVLVGPDEQGLASKIFGRNLDDFLATRLGAALAVVNLVLSVYAAVHASDPLERVADDLMATTAGLDLIAAVAGWALGAAGITAGTAVATICSAIGVLGILAALAGVAILLYLVFRPRPNPVQQFTSTYAQPAGFYMQYRSEIDYFVGYTPGTGPQRVGCSFVIPSASRVLSVGSDGTTVEAAPQSYGYRSVFVISTGGTGQSRIITVAPTGSGGLQTVVLTWATDNTVSFQPPLDPANPNYFTQLWALQMQGVPQMDGAFPAAATFAVTAFGTSSALVWNGTNLILGSGPGWRIEQAPMAPAGLSMQTIRLYTVSKGQSFRPTLVQNGSAPRTWSVVPAPPSFLTLDTTSGQIAESATAGDLPVTKATQYTLSVTNGVGTAPPPAPFTIEVRSYL